MRGFFISFEGLDGAGKTTQVRFLAERLEELGWDVVTVREPGGTVLGEAIRRILKDPALGEVTPGAEACLYIAARVEMVTRVVLPAFLEGKIVLADRFTDSTLAYQGAGRGVPENLLTALHSLLGMKLAPDLTILLDVPEEEALARVRGSKEIDRLERKEDSFFSRVREGYLRLAQSASTRFVVIDGRKAPG